MRTERIVLRIDDRLLDALADRWPNIVPDWAGQTFGAWLIGRMHYYNEFGYVSSPDAMPEWFDEPDSLWELIAHIPPCGPDAFLERKAQELRETGGDFIQRIADLRPLARVILAIGG